MKRNVIILIMLLLFFSCQDDVDNELVERILDMESVSYKGEEVPQDLKEQIKTEILRFEEKSDDLVKVSGEVSMYYKMLALNYLEIERIKQEIAIRKQFEEDLEKELDQAADLTFYNTLTVKYVDFGNFSKALDALKMAIKLDSNNPVLFYLAGLCASQVTSALVDAESEQERQQWLADAEAYYKKAIVLDPQYVDALFAYSVLLVFDLNRPHEAEEYLDGILQEEKNNMDAKLLLAGVYYMDARFEDALDMLNDVIVNSKVQNRIDEAMAFKERIESELNEQTK
jgi:tetratricopeptide (TPR) repeat protein